MSLVVPFLSITILIFTAAVIRRAHLLRPSFRQVRADAGVTAAARAAVFARLN